MAFLTVNQMETLKSKRPYFLPIGNIKHDHNVSIRSSISDTHSNGD